MSEKNAPGRLSGHFVVMVKSKGWIEDCERRIEDAVRVDRSARTTAYTEALTKHTILVIATEYSVHTLDNCSLHQRAILRNSPVRKHT